MLLVPIGKISNKNNVRQFILDVLSEFGFAYSKDYDNDLDSLDEYYSRPEYSLYVFVHEDDVYATIGIEPISEEEVKIKRFYVKKEYRQRGFGSKMYNHILRKIKKLGYKRIILETTTRNKSAVNFFLKQGFYIKPEGKVKIQMSKDIITSSSHIH